MYYNYPRYVSVAEKEASARKKLKALKKKKPGIRPIVIKGRTLANTWWGKSWNRNLERYADYANRIGRGRSYVRHGAVLDLQITPGKIDALVSGSHTSPYRVTISIKAIPKKQWSAIQQQCKDQMDSLTQLLAGKFPKALEAVFTRKGQGLFPSPEEISLDCSCPDWAVMCKHVAAVLYGVGARLDDDPSLFFVLRKVNVQDLVSETVTAGKTELLERAEKRSSRQIEEDVNLSDMFGIDLDVGDGEVTASVQPTPPRKTGPSRDTGPTRKIKNAAGIETCLKRRTKRTTPVAELIERSDMDPQKVRNILFRLVRTGKVKRVSRGVYQWIR